MFDITVIIIIICDTKSKQTTFVQMLEKQQAIRTNEETTEQIHLTKLLWIVNWLCVNLKALSQHYNNNNIKHNIKSLEAYLIAITKIITDSIHIVVVIVDISIKFWMKTKCIGSEQNIRHFKWDRKWLWAQNHKKEMFMKSNRKKSGIVGKYHRENDGTIRDERYVV